MAFYSSRTTYTYILSRRPPHLHPPKNSPNIPPGIHTYISCRGVCRIASVEGTRLPHVRSLTYLTPLERHTHPPYRRITRTLMRGSDNKKPFFTPNMTYTQELSRATSKPRPSVTRERKILKHLFASCSRARHDIQKESPRVQTDQQTQTPTTTNATSIKQTLIATCGIELHRRKQRHQLSENL